MMLDRVIFEDITAALDDSLKVDADEFSPVLKESLGFIYEKLINSIAINDFESATKAALGLFLLGYVLGKKS